MRPRAGGCRNYRTDYIWLASDSFNGTVLGFDHLVPGYGCSSLSVGVSQRRMQCASVPASSGASPQPKIIGIERCCS